MKAAPRRSAGRLSAVEYAVRFTPSVFSVHKLEGEWDPSGVRRLRPYPYNRRFWDCCVKVMSQLGFGMIRVSNLGCQIQSFA